MNRPENHVTRAQAALQTGREVKLPILDRESLEALEALFPPRCISRTQTIEDHLRYAGVVEHVQSLRAAFDSKRGEDPHEEDFLDNLGEDASRQQK